MENHTDINKTLNCYFNDFAKQLAEIRNNIKDTTSPEYLTPPQTSALTGFSLRALEAMRSKRSGPNYIKVGKTKNSPIRYRLEDIYSWMLENSGVHHAAQ